MKERPILFSGEMVRAILEGRKTQTRRVVKPQPEIYSTSYLEAPYHIELAMPGCRGLYPPSFTKEYCTYGKRGDRLWVRESFNTDWGDRGQVLYKADGGSAIAAGYSSEPRWKPSIHMPRWASRITLEITGAGVERLQEITSDDAYREGVERPDGIHFKNYLNGPEQESPIGSFRTLWESINGADSWNANPWVWVVEFRRLEAP